MSIKERLIAAIGDTSWDDLPEAALVELVLEQLKRTKAALFEAQAAVIKEGRRAHELEESYRKEMRSLRTNPLFAIHGDFYFVDASGDIASIYVVLIEGGRISIVKRVGRIDYQMRQLSRQEYERHMP